MPLYEFSCLKCGNEFVELVRSHSTGFKAVCHVCGSTDSKRRISAFAFHPSESSRLEKAGGPENPSPEFYKDPRNIGRWTEKKFKEYNIDIPEHLRNMIDASREGQFPESLKDLKSGPTEI